MTSEDRISNLFIKLRGELARAILRLVPPKEMEDIVQETYVRACQISNKERVTKPRAFLFKIAKNLALDYWKKANTRLSVDVENTDELEHIEAGRLSDSTLASAVSGEEFAEFCEAVRKLPPQRRLAFVMKKVYGYSQREIAAEMQLSEKTVERHIKLGMDDCLEYLEANKTPNQSETNSKRAKASKGSRPTHRGHRS